METKLGALKALQIKLNKTKMIKPIFLVGIPMLNETNTEEDQRNAHNLQKSLEQELDQYYPLVYMQSGSSEISFKCFFEKDFDKIKFEELKQIVLGTFKTDI